MNISITFKNFEPSEHLKKYANRRFNKLGRFLPPSEESSMQVSLAVDKFRHKVDVQLVADGLNLSAMEQSEDMYASIDMVLDKLQAQVKKFAEKGKEHRSPSNAGQVNMVQYGKAGEDAERSIVYMEDFDPKPMHTEEAAMQLDMLDYEFLVFRNAQNSRINVIYRRHNGDFGLIDPGF